MDYAACNVVYVDRAARQDKLVKKEDLLPVVTSTSIPNHIHEHGADRQSPNTLDANLQTLLATFGEGWSRVLGYLHMVLTIYM